MNVKQYRKYNLRVGIIFILVGIVLIAGGLASGLSTVISNLDRVMERVDHIRTTLSIIPILVCFAIGSFLFFDGIGKIIRRVKHFRY